MRDRVIKIGIVFCSLMIVFISGVLLFSYKQENDKYKQENNILKAQIENIKRFDRDVEYDPLYQLATDKVNESISIKDIEHDLQEYSNRLQNLNSLSGRVGENLYTGGPCDIRLAVKMWQESAPHRAVLDSDYDRAILVVQRDGASCYGVLETQR